MEREVRWKGGEVERRWGGKGGEVEREVRWKGR